METRARSDSTLYRACITLVLLTEIDQIRMIISVPINQMGSLFNSHAFLKNKEARNNPIWLRSKFSHLDLVITRELLNKITIC